MKRLAIESLAHSDTQTRAKPNKDRIEQLAEAIQGGEKLPPPLVFQEGEIYWVADGFHRIRAYTKAGRKEIECDVREGNRLIAIEEGIKANVQHDNGGLVRTNKDKRHSVKMLLSALAEQGENWADRRIAETCGVDHKTVANVRRQLGKFPSSPPESAESRGRVGADGKVRKTPAKKLKPEPKSKAAPKPEPKAAQEEEEHNNPFQGFMWALKNKPEEKEQTLEEANIASREGKITEQEYEELVDEYDNEWSEEVYLEHTLFVTIGQMFEIWSRNAPTKKASVLAEKIQEWVKSLEKVHDSSRNKSKL